MWEGELSSFARSFDHSWEPSRCNWSSSLCCEDVGARTPTEVWPEEKDRGVFSVADDETETRELFRAAAAQTYLTQERRLEKIRQGAFANGREA